MENAGQESLSRPQPKATKNVAEDELANEPAAVKSCLMVTAIGELLIKKNPAIEVTADKPMFHVPDEEMQENLSS